MGLSYGKGTDMGIDVMASVSNAAYSPRGDGEGRVVSATTAHI